MARIFGVRAMDAWQGSGGSRCWGLRGGQGKGAALVVKARGKRSAGRGRDIGGQFRSVVAERGRRLRGAAKSGAERRVRPLAGGSRLSATQVRGEQWWAG